MKQVQFKRYLTQLRSLTPKQRQQLSKVLAQAPKEHTLPSQVLQREHQLDRDRTCLYCQASGTVRNGRTSGLIRFRCRATGCGKTYTALSQTGLAHLRCRDKWEAYQDCVRQRMTLHAVAKHCGINYRTAFLWRHRMIAPVHLPDALTGVVEMDETYFRESAKGDWTLKQRRKPRKRGRTRQGEPACRKEPVLTAVARGGTTLAWAIGTKEVVPIRVSMRAWTSPDAIVVSDANPSYSSATQALGRSHEVLNMSRGEHVRGPWHLNTVNQRHSTMKARLNHQHRGVATRYLDNYLHWFSCQDFRVDKSLQPDFIQRQLSVNPQLDT